MDDLKEQVNRIRWWHTIDLGGGVVTPGASGNLRMLPNLGLPERLDGKTVLDVGAWDGFFSFESERRGAARVLATDSFAWQGDGWGSKAGFELARETLHSQVEDVTIDVLELSPDRVGTFDLVLCLGVLYHMRHPMLALERVFSVTGDQLILETHVDLLTIPRPAIALYPHGELDGDPTSWCGPNPAAVEAMLGAVGFRRVKLVSHYSLLRTVAGGVFTRIRKGNQALVTLERSRMVFHAWR
jgi:tRNA (mo5U34)-methyltransferase